MPADPTALLSLEQAETLWHEMGHALHSLLSRTHYQHLSGAPAGQDILHLVSVKAVGGTSAIWLSQKANTLSVSVGHLDARACAAEALTVE